MKYHQSKQEKHDDRISKLKQVDDKFDYTGLSYPVSFEDIKLFENNNKIAVFVYYINDENIIAKEKNGNPEYRNNIIYLLRIEDDNKSHYVYIKHISRLMNLSNHTGDKDQIFPILSKVICI